MSRIALAAMSGVLFAACAASASTLPPLTGSYEGSYDALNVSSVDDPNHAVWLPGLFSFQDATNHPEQHWSFGAGAGSFDYNGGVAGLSGVITNNEDPTRQLMVDVGFDFVQKGGRVSKCDYGASVCDSADYQAKEANFEYFTYGQATLTGIGALDGLILSLTIMPADGTYPPQLGYGANDKDASEFGFSSWFFWNVEQNTSGVALVADNGRGDFNLELGATPVPLPAALPLFAAALAGLGFVARRAPRRG